MLKRVNSRHPRARTLYYSIILEAILISKKYFLIETDSFAVFYVQKFLFLSFCGYIARYAPLKNKSNNIEVDPAVTAIFRASPQQHV